MGIRLPREAEDAMQSFARLRVLLRALLAEVSLRALPELAAADRLAYRALVADGRRGIDAAMDTAYAVVAAWMQGRVGEREVLDAVTAPRRRFEALLAAVFALPYKYS
jgi:hypothetical protein